MLDLLPGTGRPALRVPTQQESGTLTCLYLPWQMGLGTSPVLPAPQGPGGRAAGLWVECSPEGLALLG